MPADSRDAIEGKGFQSNLEILDMKETTGELCSWQKILCAQGRVKIGKDRKCRLCLAIGGGSGLPQIEIVIDIQP
jgi:hypothetical protein